MFTVSSIIFQYPTIVGFFFKLQDSCTCRSSMNNKICFFDLPTQSQLPLNFTSSINNGNWTGCAFVPASYFPPKVTKFNAYAIHGSGPGRVYEALYPASAEKHTEPDL